MRYEKALLPTLKQAPADATLTSQILLMRGGFLRQVGAGIYSFLPLGLRVLRHIEAIVRAEMDAAGAQEVLLPALLPADYFKESGRWDTFGDALLRLSDRKGADYHLGPTHEEIMCDLARREIQSYRELPKNLYQIQSKFRDEPRPRGGLLRGREFLMKDAYSFDVDHASALKSYETMRLAYRRIFDSLGLNYRMVGADSGAMGGDKSAEFQVLVQSGEDYLAACTHCEYAENLEVARAVAPDPAAADPVEPPAVCKVETPGLGSISEVASFLKQPATRILKSLIYSAGGELVMAVVRGDHDVSEVKLARAVGVPAVHLAAAADVTKASGVSAGFVGPVGFRGKIWVDADAAAVADGIAGANLPDHHLLHVKWGRDYEATVASLRNVQAGDPCPNCQKPVSIFRGIEAGHIFVLGTHYTEKMGALYLDASGKKHPLVMGCYGIGISRLVASVVEQFHDEGGIVWPFSIAPFKTHICQLGDSDEVRQVVDDLEEQLCQAGFEPLVDDRDVRPGVKFKDADLIGVPWRVTVGERGLKEGQVELKARSERDPRASEAVSTSEIAQVLIARLQAASNEIIHD